MDDMTRDDALKQLREAIKRAGGLGAVAEQAGCSYTYLSCCLNDGRQIGREVAIKLRPLLDLAAEVWADLLVPLPADTESTATA